MMGPGRPRDDADDTLDTFVDVTLIHDPALGSPPDTASKGGRTVAVPPRMIPLPRRGKLFGMPGFGRQSIVPVDPGDPAKGTVQRWEWVMLGEVDPIDEFVDSLAPGGWKDPAARTTVRTMIARLYSAGIPRTTIVGQIPSFVNAIRNEVAAEQAAG
jgi:hypothetical protein